MKGRFTIPADASLGEQTKVIAEKWGADAVRDCDGTDLPENPKQFGKVYNTYFVVRGDNEWGRLHPEEAQRMFLISDRVLAVGETVEIEIMKHYLKGYSYKDIAKMLGKSSKSIDNALSRIKIKLEYLRERL